MSFPYQPSFRYGTHTVGTAANGEPKVEKGDEDRTNEREGKHPTRVICIHGQPALRCDSVSSAGVSSNRLSALMNRRARFVGRRPLFFLFFFFRYRENSDSVVKIRDEPHTCHSNH